MSANRPEKGDEIRIIKDTFSGERTYTGTVLDFDDSGDFALVWWEDGTRDYRYIHKGYDPELDEIMEWG